MERVAPTRTNSRTAIAAAALLGSLFVGFSAVGPAAASHDDAGNPELLVTGHTVLASNIGQLAGEGATPDDGDAGSASRSGSGRNGECVVWFNGVVVFDGTPSPGNHGGDFNELNDNAADPCGTILSGLIWVPQPTDYAVLAGLILGGMVLAMAVEAGDCDPRTATAAEFVRDLSFTDPNGQAHLVAEVRYMCSSESLLHEFVGGDVDSLRGHIPDSPPSGDGDPMLSNGQDPTVLNLALNESFVEYAWVTTNHALVLDPTLDEGPCVAPVDGGYQDVCTYNYALIVDTCNDAPRSGRNSRSSGDRCTDGGGEEFPRGSSYRGPRFDDSARSRIVHAGCPTDRDEVRDGNANRLFGDEIGCLDDHREDRTADWDLGTGSVTETDYDQQEDHLVARVDVYVSAENCINGATTAVGSAYCAAILTPLILNHPGCSAAHDAVFGDACWNPMGIANDGAGVGGRDVLEGSVPWT